MKKMITISALTLSLSLSAQHAIPQHQQVLTKNSASLSNLKITGTTTDTLRPASLSKGGCAVSTATATAGQYLIYYYTIDYAAPIDSGYLFGSNILNINEVAQKYTVTGSASVSDVMFIANAAYSSGNATKVISNIYSQNPTTKGPSNTVLGTASKPLINISAFSYNTITFSTSVVVDNSTFFATILSPPLGGSTQDTLALLTTAYGCTSSDSLGWIKTPSQWYSMKTFFGAAKYAVDFVIFPVVTIPTTAGINSVTKENLSLLAAYPNPANTSININFSLSESSKTDIEIYDLTGKLVIAVKGNNSFTEGQHVIPIDINSLAPGSYFYSINTDKAKIFSKFSVVK